MYSYNSSSAAILGTNDSSAFPRNEVLRPQGGGIREFFDCFVGATFDGVTSLEIWESQNASRLSISELAGE